MAPLECARVAKVAELVDAQDSGSCPGNRVGVRVPPFAPHPSSSTQPAQLGRFLSTGLRHGSAVDFRSFGRARPGPARSQSPAPGQLPASRSFASATGSPPPKKTARDLGERGEAPFHHGLDRQAVARDDRGVEPGVVDPGQPERRAVRRRSAPRQGRQRALGHDLDQQRQGGRRRSLPHPARSVQGRAHGEPGRRKSTRRADRRSRRSLRRQSARRERPDR